MQKARIIFETEETSSPPIQQSSPPLQEQETTCPHCQSYIDYLGSGKWGCEACDIE